MRLATYQPMQRNHMSNGKPWHRFREYLGYEPVFCFPAETAEQFLFGCFYVAASYSECLYVFDTDNYRMFDFIKWIEVMYNEDLSESNIASLFSNVNPRYAEFVVPESKLDNAMNIIPVSEMIQDVIDSYSNAEHIFDVRNRLGQGMAEADRYVKSNMDYMNTDSGLIKADLMRRYTENVLGYSLYKLAYDLPLEYPADFIPVYPPIGDKRGRRIYERDDKLLMDMYHGNIPFTRRNFNRSCRMFEKLLQRHDKAVQKMEKDGTGIKKERGILHGTMHVRPAV